MGVPVSFEGVSTYPDGEPVRGLFERPMQLRLMEAGIGGAQVALPTVTLPFNAFARMPAANDTLYVDGVAYTVCPPTAEDDGALLCYELQAA